MKFFRNHGITTDHREREKNKSVVPSIKSKHHKEKRTVQSNNQLPPLNAVASLNKFDMSVTLDVSQSLIKPYLVMAAS